MQNVADETQKTYLRHKSEINAVIKQLNRKRALPWGTKAGVFIHFEKESGLPIAALALDFRSVAVENNFWEKKYEVLPPPSVDRKMLVRSTARRGRTKNDTLPKLYALDS